VEPIQSFKRFNDAVVVLGGVELVERLRRDNIETDRLAANEAINAPGWKQASPLDWPVGSCFGGFALQSFQYWLATLDIPVT
jgi:hypothetical protein